MGPLPAAMIRVLRPFEAVFSERVWAWAQELLVGAILVPGQRSDRSEGAAAIGVGRPACRDGGSRDTGTVEARR
jgi:hypothetical protein